MRLIKMKSCAVVAAITLVAELAGAETPSDLVQQGIEAADRGKNAEAIALATKAIEMEPTFADAYKLRGRELFRAGRIRESVVDFDKYATLEPRLEPRQWERGIAYYYAGEFEKGAAQFERYQRYDGHDVENSVWRFLCMVPQVGVARAQAIMLPIENDRRVPMMQIYDLYRGKCQVDDVLAAAKEKEPNTAEIAGRHFYAHLYLGLWFDANGNKDEAKRYIEMAVDEKLRTNPLVNPYMWDVARIHQKLLRGELKVAKP